MCARAALDSPTDLATAVGNADVVFIAVGTPSRRGDGHADLSFVYARRTRDRARWFGLYGDRDEVDGAGRDGRRVRADRPRERTRQRISRSRPIRSSCEGSAIEDFKRPDRIVVGIDPDDVRAKTHSRSLSTPLSQSLSHRVHTIVVPRN